MAVSERATIAVGTAPNGIAVDPARRTLYVANRGCNSLFIVDMAALRVVATVDVGAGPGGIAVDSALHKVFVANRDRSSVSVVDGATYQTIETVALTHSLEAVATGPLATPSSQTVPAR